MHRADNRETDGKIGLTVLSTALPSLHLAPNSLDFAELTFQDRALAARLQSVADPVNKFE